jgi:predicted alpha/beta superfamily hydrolase
MRMRIPISLFLLFALTHPGYAQSANEIVIGSKHSVYSEVLGESRDYWVSLPDSYGLESESHKTYPILVVLDGRSLFRPISGTLSFMSASRNGSRRVPEMIVVGIPSTNRERDFTPDKIVTRRENDTGGGDRFLGFLENELLPVLRGAYRTSPYSMLVGHSLGGLLATHAYLKSESTFNAFIAIDPSFGSWDADTMDPKIDAITGQSFDRFLYLATANWGARNLRNRDRHVRFYEALHRRVGGGQFRARLEYFEDENHGSVPLIAFYNGMSEIFQGYGMSYRDVTSLEQLTSHYHAISERLSHDFQPPEELVNRVGYQMLRSDDSEQKAAALELFELNATNHSGSFNVFDSLGEAYASLGQKAKAIESYRRSLEINPGNENAKDQLELLGVQ